MKKDLTWGPVEAWWLCRNCCACVVYACVLYTSLSVCFLTRLPFTIRILPLILPVCYIVAVLSHPRHLPSSPRYTSATVFKKMLLLYVSLCSSFNGTVNIIDWVNNDDALVIKWVKKKQNKWHSFNMPFFHPRSSSPLLRIHIIITNKYVKSISKYK